MDAILSACVDPPSSRDDKTVQTEPDATSRISSWLNGLMSKTDILRGKVMSTITLLEGCRNASVDGVGSSRDFQLSDKEQDRLRERNSHEPKHVSRKESQEFSIDEPCKKDIEERVLKNLKEMLPVIDEIKQMISIKDKVRNVAKSPVKNRFTCATQTQAHDSNASGLKFSGKKTNEATIAKQVMSNNNELQNIGRQNQTTYSKAFLTPDCNRGNRNVNYAATNRQNFYTRPIKGRHMLTRTSFDGEIDQERQETLPTETAKDQSAPLENKRMPHRYPVIVKTFNLPQYVSAIKTVHDRPPKTDREINFAKHTSPINNFDFRDYYSKVKELRRRHVEQLSSTPRPTRVAEQHGPQNPSKYFAEYEQGFKAEVQDRFYHDFENYFEKIKVEKSAKKSSSELSTSNCLKSVTSELAIKDSTSESSSPNCETNGNIQPSTTDSDKFPYNMQKDTPTPVRQCFRKFVQMLSPARYFK